MIRNHNLIRVKLKLTWSHFETFCSLIASDDEVLVIKLDRELMGTFLYGHEQECLQYLMRFVKCFFITRVTLMDYVILVILSSG